MDKLSSVLSSLNKSVATSDQSPDVSSEERKEKAQSLIAEIERLNVEVDSLKKFNTEHYLAWEKSRSMSKDMEQQLKIDQKAQKLASSAKDAEIKSLQKLFKDDDAVKMSSLVALGSRPVTNTLDEVAPQSFESPAPPYVSELYPKLGADQHAKSDEISKDAAKPVLVGQQQQPNFDLWTPPASARSAAGISSRLKSQISPELAGAIAQTQARSDGKKSAIPQQLKFDNSTKKRVDLAQLVRASPGKELQWIDFNVGALKQFGLTTPNILTSLLATTDGHLSLQSYLTALLLNVNMSAEEKLATLIAHVNATFKKSHLSLMQQLRSMLENIRYDNCIINPIQAITTAFAQEGILLDD